MPALDLECVDTYLASVASRGEQGQEDDSSVEAAMKAAKARAVEEGDQATAKRIWCYQQILRIQQSYLAAFQAMKEGRFYDAWCLLERVEIELSFLEPHLSPEIGHDDYRLAFIATETKQFQALYPYRFFLSPAWLYLEKVCSICGKPVSLRNPCGHRKGEVYNGEMCGHEITKCELLEMSLVPNPVQSTLWASCGPRNRRPDGPL